MITEPPRPAPHPIALLGVLLMTLSALAFLALLLFQGVRLATNPYVGLMTFIAIPALFVLGLALIALASRLTRRRTRLGLAAVRLPRLDLNDARTRVVAFASVVATIASVALLMASGFGVVHYMDSPSFCGALCHESMQPQFVQWQRGPHAQVACVSCHMGAESGSFIQTRLAGLRQLAHVLTGRVPRHISASAASASGTADACEHCHSIASFSGDRTRRLRSYASDEANTEMVTTLTIRVGPGGTSGPDQGAGVVHWHAQPGRVIEYAASAADPNGVAWVRLTEPNRAGRVFVATGVSARRPAAGVRRMDCVTCHNRVAHPFSTTAERVVDEEMGRGRLDRALPYLRREAVRLLKAEHTDSDQAVLAIARDLHTFYAKTHPDELVARRSSIDQAVRVLQGAYLSYVFPSMKVTWGTHPNQLGHTDAPGCFRCHDDGHRAAEGSVIRRECGLCHVMSRRDG